MKINNSVLFGLEQFANKLSVDLVKSTEMFIGQINVLDHRIKFLEKENSLLKEWSNMHTKEGS